jgi:hypothetical protein
MTELASRFSDIVSDFAKDNEKETKGVWMTFGRHEFRIARAHRNNTKFLKIMEQEMRPYQWAIDRGNFEAIRVQADEVMRTVYSKTILTGIRKLDTKEELEYSPEDGVALFKQLPDLWDTIFKFSNQESNYTPDAVEADSKN